MDLKEQMINKLISEGSITIRIENNVFCVPSLTRYHTAVFTNKGISYGIGETSNESIKNAKSCNPSTLWENLFTNDLAKFLAVIN